MHSVLRKEPNVNAMYKYNMSVYTYFAEFSLFFYLGVYFPGNVHSPEKYRLMINTTNLRVIIL